MPAKHVKARQKNPPPSPLPLLRRDIMRQEAYENEALWSSLDSDRHLFSLVDGKKFNTSTRNHSRC